MKHARVVSVVMAALLLGAIQMAGANGTVAEVSIDNMLFTPQHIKVKSGTTVKWVNNEKRNNHSVYFKEEGLPESERFPGESWSRTFEKPGLYPYICGPHPEMTGTVEVVK